MKKFFIVFLFAVFSFAFDWNGKVNWVMSFDIAKQIAKSEHKLIMVDVAGEHCPPCRYLATNVYTDEKVANYINNNFLPVLYIVEEDTLPKEVLNHFPRSTPTIMFFDENGKFITEFVGARPKGRFLQILKEVYQRSSN